MVRAVALTTPDPETNTSNAIRPLSSDRVVLAGLLLYRYFLTPHELRTLETDEQWLDRVVDLGERLLAPRSA